MLGNGLGCYDLDHCVTSGEVDQWARDYVLSLRLPIVFIELSCSATGLHVFVETSARRGWRREGVEFYPNRRFIRTTGKGIEL